jgi:hypothetical protein
LQLNYRHAGLRRAALAELLRAAGAADGVWIRHADELSPSLIASSWGSESAPSDGSRAAEVGFLGEALAALRSSLGRTLIIVEGEGGDATGAGADLVLDARLRDLLAARDAAGLRDHLLSTRTAPRAAFLSSLEGEGWPRAARAFPTESYFGAALVAALAPGGVAFHDGQLEGRRSFPDPRLNRRAEESRDREIEAFHQSLLEILARAEVARGEAMVPAIREAWEGNVTWRQIVPFLYRGEGGAVLLAAVNYGPSPAQGFVDLSGLEPKGHEWAGQEWTLQDLLGLAVYRREGGDLRARGLYLDLPAWDYHAFEVSRGRPT